METTFYSDLDLRIHQDRNDDTWIEAVVRPGHPSEPVQLLLPTGSDFSDRVARFAGGTASQADAERLGQTLFKALLPGGLHALWDWAVRSLGRENPLRLRLDIQDPSLASLPWELICSDTPASYPFVLSPQRPVVRCSALVPEPGKKAFPPRLRILVIVAEPGDRPAFDAATAVRRVEAALRKLGSRADLRVVEHITTSRLADEVTGDWDVVQFVGHGGRHHGSDCLLFEDDAGRTEYVDGRRLGALLLAAPRLRLFLSCACGGVNGYGGDRAAQHFLGVAEAVFRAEVPAVVTMQSQVTDGEVADFSWAFYQALTEGQRLEAAMANARHHLATGPGHRTAWAAPVLYSNIRDGMLFDEPPVPKDDEPYIDDPPAPARLLVDRLPWSPYRRFPGRERELRLVGDALDRRERLVLVRGPAGHGSSSLMIEAARRYLADPGRSAGIGGAAWARRRTSPLSGPFPKQQQQRMGWSMDDLYQQIASGLRVHGLLQATEQERWHLLRRALSQRRCLLVIDDIDEVRGSTLADLLDRFPPPTTVLATSHAPEDAGPEQGCTVRVDGLEPGDAYAFVRDCAAELGLSRGRVPDAEELRELLCDAVTDTFALRLFVGALADGVPAGSLALSEGGSGGALAGRLIARSRQRLSEPERTALELVAVFPAPLTLSQLALTLSQDEQSTRQALRRLERLGLVTVRPGAETVHLTQRVRQQSLCGYGQAKAQQLIRRAVRHALDLAEHGTRWQRGEWDSSDDTLANEVWAVEQAHELRDWHAVLRFRYALWHVLYRRQLYSDAVAVGDWAYDAADRLDDALNQAWCAVYPIAAVYAAQGALERARLWSERAYDKFEHLDHRHGRAVAERVLAEVLQQMRLPDDADAHRRRGLALAVVDTPLSVRGDLVSGLASTAEARGDHDEAEGLYRQALSLYRQGGYKWGEALVEHRLGRLALSASDESSARARLRASLGLYERMDAPGERSRVLCSLAETEEARGDFAWAHTYLLRAVEQLESLPVTDGLTEAHAALARVRARQEVPLFDGLPGLPSTYEVWVRCPECPTEPAIRILHHYEPLFPTCARHDRRYVETEPPRAAA
ncbi:CHAT domain-containing protein [Streptomyces sp. CRN 30]|uniref:CHAT domain-containing protein n=1 Tax=Streptomyces sp. CRN 30 TaxID=3075613 RepID=UPI002A7EC903|nr:CHAT domain-containing protein [Streptomyces sp. CRN 30]